LPIEVTRRPEQIPFHIRASALDQFERAGYFAEVREDLPVTRNQAIGNDVVLVRV
jgi:hypothetical protein